MIHNFITTIISFALWNRVTKDQQEKTYKSSLLRVIIYAVLTFITGVYLYQTYQVSHIRDYVFVHGIRGSFLGDSVVTDTVFIQFNKVFRHPRTATQKDSLIQKFVKSMSSDEFPFNGMMLSLYCRNDSSTNIHFFPNEKQPKDKNIAANGPLYKIDYFSSTVPTVNPFCFIFSNPFKLENPASNLYVYSRNESLYYTIKNEKTKKTIREKMGKFGYHDQVYCGFYSVDNNPSKKLPFTSVFGDADLNLLDIFSAADISKCIYSIYVGSDCPLGYLGANFDIPVDMNTYNMPADEVTFTGFNVGTAKNLEEIRKEGSYTFFVKFPTLENLQLIRSLVLTSLATIFATLFFTNLFYCLRKLYVWIQRKNRMSISEARLLKKNKVRFYKVIILLLYLLFLAFISYLGYRILKEDYYFVLCEDRKIIWLYVGLALILLVSLIIFLRKKLIVKGKK